MTSNIIGSEWINGSKGWLWRGNSKSIFHGTGTEIAALDPVTPTSRYAFAGNGNDSVGSNNLTANGTPTYGSDGGVYGQYVILNGSSQYFTAANNTVFDVTTQDFSIWGFLYVTGGSGTTRRFIMKRDASSGTNKGYGLAINSSNKLAAEICDGSASVLVATSTSGISTNIWYFFAVSFTRAGNMVLHIYNMSTGAYETATTAISTQATSITNTKTFTVGASVTAGEFTPGRIDHLNVLIGTAITAQNVQDIISKLHGGQIAQCHGTSGGFTSGLTYKRDMENTTWYQLVDSNNDQTVAGNKSLTGTTTLSDARISTDASIIKHSTTNNAGDLLKNTGTKYDRFARGSAFNFLRVNSGATDIEYDEIFGNELARTELGSSGSSISVASLTAKKHLFVIAKLIAAGGGSVTPTIRFNNDSGANYSYRYSTSGAAETTGTSATSITAGAGVNATGIIYLVIHILNESANRKLVWIQYVDDQSAGAGTAPARTVIAGKWDNTAAQITRIDVLSTFLDTGSRVVVFGLD